MDVTGKLTKVLELQSGVSKAGKEWQKQSFLIETDAEYNNLYCFELFGAEKVEDFTQRYGINDELKIEFNVSCNEWNGRYFTSLSAWKIEKLSGTMQQSAPAQEQAAQEGENSSLPF